MYESNKNRLRINWLYENYCYNTNELDIDEFIAVINSIYYKYSSDLYGDRYIKDIENQFDNIFNNLGSLGENINIINIGGGDGFEFQQIKRNKIKYNNYVFIEPDINMINKFKGKYSTDLSKIKIINGYFKDNIEYIKSIGPKLIILNSCLHHVIWLDNFVKEIKSSVSIGDYLVISHEPNNDYYKSILFFINYIIRSITTNLLFKKIGFYNDNNNNLRWEKINKELISKKIIKSKMSPIIIRRIIDYGANNKGDSRLLKIPEDYNEGYWNPSDIKNLLASQFECIYFRTYRHLGDSKNNYLIKLINKILCKYFINYGSDFSIVFKCIK